MSTKFIAKFVGVAMVLSLAIAGAAAPAQAVTVDELQAQIDALLAQLAGLQGGSSSSSSCYNYTRDLTIGSTGADVVELQTMLVGSGNLVMPAGVSMGYFGPLTQSALASYQAANGIAPASGYFGPITRGHVAANCTTGGSDMDDDDDSSSSDLQGGAGSISDADFISSLNNEEVGEDEEDVEVAGLEIEAEGSDIELRAVNLNFDYADSGADDDLDDYASEVSVWFNGEEVARLDADEFDDDNNYSRSVSLDRGAIIDEDETGDLTVALSGVSNLDSTNAGENWNVSFVSIRFQDAQDAVVTDNTTGDIGETDDDTTTDSDERQFSFETFATAADAEVQFDEDDDDINDAHVIDIDATDDTDNVEVLSFEIEVEGDSTVNLDDLPVEFDSVGFDLEDGLNSVDLWYDGERIGSENIPASAGTNETITFSDLDMDLDPGKHSFIVSVDLQSVADGLAAGDTIAANIGATERAAADIEDENGDDVASGDRTGSATGEAHALYDSGIMVDFVSKSSSKTFTADESGEKDQVTFEFVFDVTSFGADAFLDKDTVATATPSALAAVTDGQAFSTTSQSTTGTTTVSSSITADDTDSNDTSFAFIVDEDDTRRFTLQIVSEAGIDGQIQQNVTGIKWGSTGADDDDATDELYNFNLDDFLSAIRSVNIQ